MSDSAVVLAAATEVLDFWLGPRESEAPGPSRASMWFAVDEGVDSEIRSRFGALVEAGLSGGLTDWESEGQSRTALIVLLDQFTRNLFRGSPRAFEGDDRVIALARGMSEGMLAELHPVERYFVLMPYMHSESLEVQREGEAAFHRWGERGPEAFRAFYANGLDYARRHRVVIERFGRFPHRNAVLGRESTPDEVAFLAENETGF